MDGYNEFEPSGSDYPETSLSSGSSNPQSGNAEETHARAPQARPTLSSGEAWGPDRVQVVTAQSDHEVASVCALVNKCYERRGYISHADPLVAFPDAERAPYYVAFLALQSGRPVGTVTLGIDSQYGLLVDEVNRPEVDAVRKYRRGICELVRLAIDGAADSKAVLVALLQQLYLVGTRLHNLSDLFVEVNPRHAPFYQRLFGFELVGARRTCARVGAPSMLLRLTREELERRLLESGSIDLGTWPSSASRAAAGSARCRSVNH